MLVIKTKQLIELNKQVKMNFLICLFHELQSNLIVNDDNNFSIEALGYVLEDAVGAGITTEALIYDYCVLAINKSTKFKKPFSPALKNILYSNAEAEHKLTTLISYLQQQL